MKIEYKRNLINLWKEQDEKITKIAKKRKITRAQATREIIEIGLSVELRKLK